MKTHAKILLTLALLLFSLLAKTKDFNSVIPVGYHAADLADDEYSEFSVLPFGGSRFEIYTPFTLKNTFTYTNKQYTLNPGNWASFAKRNNTVYAEMMFNSLVFSGKNKGMNFRVSITDEVIGGINLKGSLIDFIDQGNEAYAGENKTFRLPISEIHFRSFNYSWATSLSKKIDIGITTKLYFGKSYFNMRSKFGIYTSELLDTISITAKGKGHVSVPLMLSEVTSNASKPFSAKDYLFETGNPGIGFDVSVNYSEKNLKIKAGITDLGAILWNVNTTNFKTNTTHDWTGIDFSGKLDFSEMGNIKENPTMVNFREKFLNRLIIPNDKSFVSLAPIGLYAYASQKQNKLLELSVFARVRLANSILRTNLMALATYSPNHNMRLTTGLAFSQNSFFNIPIALDWEKDRFKFGLASNNLLGAVIPDYSKNFGGSFNLSYRFYAGGKIEEFKRRSNALFPFFQPVQRQRVSGRIF